MAVQGGRDGRRFEIRSSRFSELRTLNFELRVARVRGTKKDV
jgi:hypothetical protein